MMKFDDYQNEIKIICKKYGVSSLTVFGSALSEAFNENSDLDFLLELKGPQNGLNRYMNIKFDLESLFNRPVDLIMPKAVKNIRIKKYIFSNLKEIYAA